MKVLDLQCAAQHSFEGWFGSEDDFASQLARGLVSCPMCGDAQIQKMLSAPRLNLRGGRNSGAVAGTEAAQAEVAAAQAPPSAGSLPMAAGAELQARIAQAVRAVLANTEDVGERFADQARAMHHGDLEQRNIRGQTTPDVAMELIEEGIDVMPLPHLPGLKETLQ